MAASDSQRYPWNLYLIKHVEDIVIFLGLQMFNSDYFCMFSCSRNAQVNFKEKPHLKNDQFLKLQIIIHP